MRRRSPTRDRMRGHVPQDQLQRGRENVAAIREQREQEQQLAQRRRQEMADREKNPTGIVRARLNVDGAKSALGELNRKLDEAIDEVRMAFQREAQVTEAGNMAREDDAKRAPALGGSKAVS